MSQNLLITITARDSASQTFRAVAGSASTMATTIDRSAAGAATSLEEIDEAGTDVVAILNQIARNTATTVGSLDRLEASAGRSAESLERIDDNTSKMAEGLRTAGDAADESGDQTDGFLTKAEKVAGVVGGAAGALAVLGREALNQRDSVAALGRAYGDSAGEMVTFADQIQETTRFSNEQARQAELTASTLVRNYGLSADQVQQVIRISADLAAVNGTSLTDATERVAAALRGEAESAEALGLTMNQSAIDAEGLTLTMSNQEAAAFRLAALTEQAGFAQGAAAAQAQTLTGRLSQLNNLFQDGRVAVGSWLGPVSELAAPLSDVALALPVVAGGAAKAATAITGNAKAMAALRAAMSPVALGLGGLVAASGAVVLAWNDLQRANAELADSFGGIETALADVDSAFLIQQFRDLQAAGDELKGRVLADGFGFGNAQDIAAAYNRELAETVNAAQDTGASLDQLQQSLYILDQAWAAGGRSLASNTAVLEDYQTVLVGGSDAAQTELANLNKELGAGTIDAAEYASRLDTLATRVGTAGDVFNPATRSADELAAAQHRAGQSANAMLSDYRNLQAGIHDYEEDLARVAEFEAEVADRRARAANRVATGANDHSSLRDYEGDREAVEAYYDAEAEAAADAAERVAAAEEEAARAAEDAAERRRSAIEDVLRAQAQLAGQLRGTLVPAIQGASDSLAAVAEPGEDVLDVLGRLGSETELVADGWADFVDRTHDAGQALDGVLGVFAQIDSLGGRAGQAGSIAAAMIGSEDERGTLERLLRQGRIGVEQYNEALQDSNTISSASREIEKDLAVLRVRQLDSLRAATAVYAGNIDRLTELTAKEQAHALAMMDSGVQAKVAAAYSAAYAVQLGELPEQVATDIVASAAQADPVLAGVLRDFGLIKGGVNGEIRVVLPDPSEAALERFETIFGKQDVQIVDGLIHVEQDDGTELVYDQFNNLIERDGTEVEVGVKTTGAKSISSIANQSGEVVVEFEPDARELVLALQEFTDATYTTTVQVDDQPLKETFDPVLSMLLTFDDDTFTPALDADPAKFDEALRAATAAGAAFNRAIFRAEISATVTGFDADLAAATREGATFNGAIFQADLSADDYDFNKVFNEAVNQGLIFDNNETYTADLSADPAEFDEALAAATKSGATFNAAIFQADLQANRKPFDDVIAALNNKVVGRVLMEIDAVDRDGDTEMRLGGTVHRGMALGGTVRSVAELFPAARLGRSILVGEAGPELVTLPFGSQVMPHGASQARQRADAAAGGMRFYGPVHVHASTPDVAAEIARQFATRSRA